MTIKKAHCETIGFPKLTYSTMSCPPQLLKLFQIFFPES